MKFTLTQVQTDTSIPLDLCETTTADTLAHLGCVIQLSGEESQAVTTTQTNKRGGPGRDGHLDGEQGEREGNRSQGSYSRERQMERERKRTSGCDTALEGMLHLAICKVSAETRV